MRGFPLASAAIVLLVAFPASAADEGVEQRIYDARGRLVAEIGSVPGERGIGFVRHHHPGESSGGLDANDCASSAYKLARWRWSAAFFAHTTAYPAEVAASLAAWDTETSRALVGSVTHGRAGTAGTYDGVNQFDWVDLGTTNTIAVTTTWFSRATGLAVESDARYNTRFAWATDGSAGAMDVQNIATHEVGHTFGLDHPKAREAGCLTMYAYGSLGETQKRTLGAGDILGIRAIYGS